MRRTGLLPLLLLLGPASGLAGPDPALPRRAMRPAEAAQRALAAFVAGEQEVLDALAARVAPDPYLVADELFRRYGKARRTPASAKHDAAVHLGAMQAFARRADRTPAGEGLALLGEAWAALDEAELAREHALRVTYVRALGASERSDEARVEALLEAARIEPGQAPHSIPLVRLWLLVSNCRQRNGQLDAALRAAERARVRAARMGWSLGLAQCLVYAGALRGRLGRRSAAIDALRQELSIRERIGEEAALPMRLAQLAILLLHGNERAEARAVAMDGAARAARLGQDAAHAVALGVRASIELESGNAEQALALFDEAKDALARSEEPEGSFHAMYVRNRLASAYLALGRPRDALDTLEEVLAYAQMSEDRYLQATVRARLGGLYARLGLHERALAELRHAVRAAERSGVHGIVARLRRDQAVLLRLSHRPGEAAARLEAALTPDLERTDPAGAAYTRIELAKALGATGRHDEALENAARALALYETLRMPRSVASAAAAMALLAANAGRTEAAERYVERALAAFAKLGEDDTVPLGARQPTAAALSKLGRHADALQLARAALEDNLEAQDGLAEREAIGLRASRIGGLAHIGVAAASRLGGVEAPAQAFWFLESARALVLAETLSNAGALLEYETTPELRTEERTAHERVAALQQQLVDALQGGGPADQAPASLRAALTEAHERLRDVRSRIERGARRIASIARPRPIDLATCQAALQPDEAYLAYLLGPHEAHLLVVTGEDARLLTLGASRTIAGRIEAFLELAGTPGGPDERLAAHLYDVLLKPATPLLGKRRRLLVSPDGPLAWLPFGALLERRGAERRRHVESRDVTFVPSATVLTLLREDAREAPSARGVLAIADPTYGEHATPLGRAQALAALPASRLEADAIVGMVAKTERTLLTGDAATVRNLREALGRRPGRWRALHIAAHAFIDPRRPRLSGLILSGGEVLSAEAVSAMRIRADLAVLSACETGRGGFAGGEGVLGLTRAFFHAGVPRVVVSSCKVPDEATRRLMHDLYEGVLGKGLAPAAALRAAQRKALAAGGARAHPYAWAGFVLWGLPR